MPELRRLRPVSSGWQRTSHCAARHACPRAGFEPATGRGHASGLYVETDGSHRPRNPRDAGSPGRAALSGGNPRDLRKRGGLLAILVALGGRLGPDDTAGSRSPSSTALNGHFGLVFLEKNSPGNWRGVWLGAILVCAGGGCSRIIPRTLIFWHDESRCSAPSCPTPRATASAVEFCRERDHGHRDLHRARCSPFPSRWPSGWTGFRPCASRDWPSASRAWR